MRVPILNNKHNSNEMNNNNDINYVVGIKIINQFKSIDSIHII